MTEINDCPFCRQGDARIAGGNSYWVNCDSCGADGPIHKDENAAIKSWNMPTDDMDGMEFNVRALRTDCARLRAELDEAKGGD